MLIMLCIATIVALLFGKISYKEIKEYVRKHTNESGDSDSRVDNTGNSSAGRAA